ncbi:MAG: flagellar basal body-associated FliL family protein [Gammaproteobacteria bacterium]|nr:flagellar basal body-associated FliL family protein [Gammaproteobacteria bacterium]
MATEETQAAPGVEPAAVAKSSSGLVKAIGLGAGLFMMMLITQLAGPILGCKLLHSMTPNCPAPEVVVGEDGKPKEKINKAPPQYLAFDPPLVASLEDKGTIRFLQVTVELMARDEKVIAAVETHMPVIRNNLLMMLGGQTVSSLTNREEKEKLRKQALAEVQKIMKANTGEAGVEDLYFTSFVVQ